MKKRVIRGLGVVLFITLSLTACGSASDNMSYTEGIKSATSSISSGASMDMGMVATNSMSMSDSISGFGEYYDESYDTYDSYGEAEYKESYEPAHTDKQSTQSQSSNLYEDKLVYRCSMDIETLDYAETYAALQGLIEKYECRIEHEEFYDNAKSYEYYPYSSSRNGYRSNKTNRMIIRVPSSNYKAFTDENGQLGNVISKNSSIENITQQYYDTTAEVDGLKKQLKRLKEMMDEARLVEDMIEINREITNVQGQINSLETDIRTMDMDTAYSYVTLNITEVVEYSEQEELTKQKTFIDRLKNQIVDTWENTLDSLESLLFGIIALIPTLVFLGLIVIVIRAILKKRGIKLRMHRKSKKKGNAGNAGVGTNVEYGTSQTFGESGVEMGNQEQSISNKSETTEEIK